MVKAQNNVSYYREAHGKDAEFARLAANARDMRARYLRLTDGLPEGKVVEIVNAVGALGSAMGSDD